MIVRILGMKLGMEAKNRWYGFIAKLAVRICKFKKKL
jgi:hypothetical protein